MANKFNYDLKYIFKNNKVIIEHTFYKDDDNELESGEELEDGEISDEDEALKNERNEPKAVCRFYNRGHCTWGTSCR